jgi:hypothetical protein
MSRAALYILSAPSEGLEIDIHPHLRRRGLMFVVCWSREWRYRLRLFPSNLSCSNTPAGDLLDCWSSEYLQPDDMFSDQAELGTCAKSACLLVEGRNLLEWNVRPQPELTVSLV